MPDEPYFREPETQRMLLDILFVFCKINQDVGYRQGMHEVLAPLLWTIDQDSVESNQTSDSNKIMHTTLDRRYVEHDAFTLLSLIMRSAKSFYELGEPERGAGSPALPSTTPHQGSPIIERSRRIHEDYLARVDPELSNHLTRIEVLPQIFLMYVRSLSVIVPQLTKCVAAGSDYSLDENFHSKNCEDCGMSFLLKIPG